MNKKQMIAAGASEVKILEAELEAAFSIIEELPVDTHDMEVHFWCNHDEDDDG
jgi:hypothetical protein